MKYVLIIFLITFFSIVMFWKLDKVDIEGSEDIYIADAVGYMHNDSFLSPRYHMKKPHYPASPHPFLVPMLNAILLKNIGVSIFSVRVLQAGLTILSSVIILLISWQLFKNTKVAILSGFVFTTLPLVVRYGRMAVLDPVLMFIEGLGMYWSWMYMSRSQHKYLYSFFMGVSMGLCLSVKLSGIFFLVSMILIFIWQFITHKHKFKENLISFSIFVSVLLLVFILFNDPNSYLYGWLNFSDPKHTNISLISILKGIIAFNYWKIFLVTLIGIVPVIILVIAIWQDRYFWTSKQKIFISVWIIGPLLCVLINPPHITGLSAEWAYLTLCMPLSIVIAHTITKICHDINGFNYLKYSFIIFLYILTNIPIMILFGLRYQPLPLPNLYKSRNVVMGDLAVKRIIEALNQEKNEINTLVITKSINFPLWLLKSNIKTEPFYHSIYYYNYIVTDNEEFIKQAQINGFNIYKREKNPSESTIYLLRKN